MKKTRLFLVAFLVVALVLSLGLVACEKTCEHVDANHDGKCDKCQESVEVQHTWDASTGKCSCGAVCEHSWSNGVCSVCGFTCAHASWSDGACEVCGLACTHDWDATTGECKLCGTACSKEHSFDAACSVCGHKHAWIAEKAACACGLTCEHWDDYEYVSTIGEDGVCTICGHKHVWDATKGSCSGCEIACDHDFGDDGVCTICGHKHVWKDGECTGCEEVCDHDELWDDNGVCENCGFVCSHSETTKDDDGKDVTESLWDATTGTCSFCGRVCTNVANHSFDAECEVCGHKHAWVGETGACSCGLECEHTFNATTARCTICNFMCLHGTETGATTGACATCGHTHQWNAGTAVCDLCALGCSHDYDDNLKCNICGNQLDVNLVYGANYTTISAYQKVLVADLDTIREAVGTISTEVDQKVLDAFNAGVTAINAGTNMKNTKEAYDAAYKAILNCIPIASGVQNFSGLDATDKTEILGIIEAYCIRNGMLGITLFENGGYVMYNDRITLGTENYITGYGFGVLAEGDITADLDTENNTAWKRYYHTTEASDPGTINYLNDQGSQVGDLFGYIGSSYYTTYMNETKDGYEWKPLLAVSNPSPVNGLDDNGQATKWRFEIHTDLKYNTNSTLDSRKAFDGRTIQPEDYITPFKLLLNQANGYYRGSEMSAATGASAIKGASAYYASTKNSRKGILSDSEADFSGVGIRVYEEGGKWYFEYELGTPVTPYYARYYISSSLYSPIPAEFVELVGVDNYLGYNSDKTETPVDNSLSLGAYTLERWDSNQQIVFKKNPYFVHASTKYKIQGVHINILPAAAEDKEANFKEFITGKIDATGIPDTKLSEFVSDPRTKSTTGDSCFKLNINALNQEDWIKLFGENGSYTQTKKEDYWEVEPALSNVHFRQALSYATNRLNLATVKGSVPSANYFSSDYMSDPENGISYNATDAHKNAIEWLLDGADQYGYSLELARQNFKIAIDELEAAGAYLPGTKENPTVITLEIAWMYAAHEEGYHKYIKQYWEEAFNDESVTGGLYRLECVFWVGNDWSDVYYEKMMKGQFDIGFGSISGNSLDPLSFFNVNSTDPVISGQFTLNWAIDTNTLTEALVYNGYRWSFDALYTATQENAIVSSGINVPSTELDYTVGDRVLKDDGSATVTIKIVGAEEADVKVEVTGLVAFGGGYIASYNEVDLFDGKDADGVKCNIKTEGKVTTITINIDARIVRRIPADPYNQGVDVYYTVTINGTESDVLKSAYVFFM